MYNINPASTTAWAKSLTSFHTECFAGFTEPGSRALNLPQCNSAVLVYSDLSFCSTKISQIYSLSLFYNSQSAVVKCRY